MLKQIPLVVVLLFLSLSADCCRCAEPPAPFDAYLHAHAVYIGKVIAIHDSLHHKEVVFEVSQNLKHVYKKRITLRVGHTSCDWKFAKDSTYLVYADRDKHGNLHTNLCTRTKLFSEAQMEVSEIHNHDMMDCKVIFPVEPSEDCGEIYDPVCGCDNRTYGNSCIAHTNGINHWKWGACPKK